MKTCEWDGCDEVAQKRVEFGDPDELVDYCPEHADEANTGQRHR